MVLIRPIQAKQSIDIGGVPNTRIDASVGEGLQTAGNAISGAAQVFAQIDQRRAEMKAQADGFRADQGFRRFGDDMALEFAKQQQDIDPSGEGFTDKVSSSFNEKAEQFIQTVPQEFRGKFAELVRTSRETWINKAAAAEIDQRNTWYRDGITKSQEGLQNQVFNDPAVFDAALSDGNRAIDSSGLPETEKVKLKEAWKDTLAKTVGEREIRNAEADPKSASSAAERLGVTGADPVSAVVSRIIGAESGGDPNAKNSKSSASGVGQFIDSTWLATVKKHRPDLAAGRSDKELLALKGNRVLGREMTTRLTEDNARDLATAGLPVTPGTLYLAHFAGIGGAKAVLRSNSDRAIVDILGPEVTKANGFLNGKTAGWLINWADGKMKGAPTPAQPADPRYASLPLTERLKIYDQTMAAAQRGQTAIDAQLKASYESQKGALQLGIQTGEVSSPQQIMQSDMTDSDKATLLSALRTRQADNANVAESVRLFGQGALSVDPYDSNGKKTVDAVWGQVSQSAPPEQLQQTAEELVRQTGTVPQPVVNEIRRAMTSGNAQEVAMAAQAAQRFATVDPAALSRRDGGSEVQKVADDFSYYVNKLNLSPDDAAKKIMELRNPEKQRERKAMEPAAKEFIKQMQDVDIASAFDDSFMGWRSNPSLGVTPSQELGIKADFLAIAENEFYQANGDPEIAKNRALEQMKRLYGVTEFGGVKAVVKHPPEKYWPVSTYQGQKNVVIDPNNPGDAIGKMASPPETASTPSLEYARRQLEADVTAVQPNADLSTIQLVTTPETDAMVKRGELPAYGILYKDKDGVYQTIPGKLWRPDISEALKASQEEGRLKVEAARQSLDLNRRVIEGLPKALPDAGMQNNPLMSTDPNAVNPAPESFWRIPSRKDVQRALRLQMPPTPAGQIDEQRQQLLDDARQNGVIPGQR